MAAAAILDSDQCAICDITDALFEVSTNPPNLFLQPPFRISVTAFFDMTVAFPIGFATFPRHKMRIGLRVKQRTRLFKIQDGGSSQLEKYTLRVRSR